MNTKTMQVLVASSSCLALVALVTSIVVCGFVESRSQETTKIAQNALTTFEKINAETRLYPVTSALAAELRKEVTTLRDELTTQIPKAQEAHKQIAASREEITALQRQLRESITREREALDIFSAAQGFTRSANAQPPSVSVPALTGSIRDKGLSDLVRTAAELEHTAEKRKQLDASLGEQFRAALIQAKALHSATEKDLERIIDVLARVEGQVSSISLPDCTRQCLQLKDQIIEVKKRPKDPYCWWRMAHAFWSHIYDGSCTTDATLQYSVYSRECYAVACILLPDNAELQNARPDLTQAVTALKRFKIMNDEIVGDLGDKATAMCEPIVAKMLYRYALELDPEDPKWQERVGRR